MSNAHRRARLVLAPSIALALAAIATAGSQDPSPKPAPPPPPQSAPRPAQDAARSLDERRSIAQDVAHFESKYRNAVARINRLMEIYKSKNDQEHVLQLERLRERLAVRRDHALEGFRKDLGEAGFQRVQTQLGGGGRKALEERAKPKPPGS